MKRIVIKIGSQIILDDEEKEGSDLNNILSEIVLLRSKGYLFTIVSSGAVALAKKKSPVEDSLIQTTKIEANPFFSKKEHQLQFSVEALNWVLTALDSETS